MPYQSHAIGTALVVTWDKPELEDVESVVGLTRAMNKRLKKPVTYVAYIPDSMAAPDGPVREAMTRSFSELREYCDHIVLILEGAGFQLSIGRAVLAGILLVSGRRGQIHVCANLDEAAALAPPAAIDYLRARRARDTGS